MSTLREGEAGLPCLAPEPESRIGDVPVLGAARAAGLDVAAGSWSAGKETGPSGDFYDLFPIGDHGWAVVIGDVCGTGPEAAAVADVARGTVRTSAGQGTDQRTVLRELNAALLEDIHQRFCTALYATLEPVDDGWRVNAATGGHPLPVLANASGVARTIGRPGSLLGVFPEVRISCWTASLGPGDTLVLYTDGLTDLPPPRGLTVAELEGLVATSAGADDARSVVAGISGRLQHRLRLPTPLDDTALLAVRVRRPGR